MRTTRTILDRVNKYFSGWLWQSVLKITNRLSTIAVLVISKISTKESDFHKKLIIRSEITF